MVDQVVQEDISTIIQIIQIQIKLKDQVISLPSPECRIETKV